jgi:transcription elongation factor Elf1
MRDITRCLECGSENISILRRKISKFVIRIVMKCWRCERDFPIKDVEERV